MICACTLGQQPNKINLLMSEGASWYNPHRILIPRIPMMPGQNRAQKAHWEARGSAKASDIGMPCLRVESPYQLGL